MNATEIQGQWNIISGILKQKWSRLTNNEFRLAEGTFEEIIGHMQMRTGETCRRLKISLGKPASDGAITPWG